LIADDDVVDADEAAALDGRLEEDKLDIDVDG